MIRNFDQMEEALVASGSKSTIVLAGSTDVIALEAVVRAVRRGIVDAVLVGDEARTAELLASLGEDPATWRIISAATENQAARKAVQLVVAGEADSLMKGLMQTATFLMTVRFGGLADPQGLVNEYTVFHYADEDRLIVCGDCAVNITPTLDQKRAIALNLAEVARSLGASPVRIACLSAVEKPEPTIPSSVDARSLQEMEWPEDVQVEGPFALDNALSAEAATHKGIHSDVAGHAEVILVPDMQAGNIIHKCVHFFGHYAYCSGLLGADVPIVMNSRTDSVECKYDSILMTATRLAAKEA